MAQVSVGCVFERLPSPRSAVLSGRDGEAPALSFFEYAPRAPLPSFATLARFRKQVTSEVKIALVAPRSTFTTPRGPMRPGPELDAGLVWLTRVADILKAFAIVLPTGAELTPGERDKSLLGAFVARLRATVPTVVIAPRGLWEPEDAAPYAASIDALYGFDPLEHDAPPGELVYARVRPMGVKSRLTEGHLAQIAERLSTAQRSYVSIESETTLRDAKRLQAAVNGLEELEDDELEDDELEESDIAGEEADPGDDDDAELGDTESDDDELDKS